MMSVREQLEGLERIAEMATVAGLKGSVDEDRMAFVMGFGLGQGRTQVVHVRIAGKSIQGKMVATFLSPCLVIQKGFLKGISREQAVDLLVRNERLVFARYGLWDGDGQSMVVASADAMLETLDPPEFEALAYHVAYAADGYEKEHGRDQF